jgi:hypothetical protein
MLRNITLAGALGRQPWTNAAYVARNRVHAASSSTSIPVAVGGTGMCSTSYYISTLYFVCPAVFFGDIVILFLCY